MIVRKRTNRPDHKMESLCTTVESLTSGYVSTRTTGPTTTTKFQYMRHISHHVFEEHEGDQCKNLEPRLSIGRTCMSITNYVNKNFDAHHSSQTVSSWILMNNMNRLKTAYRYLTPIIDDIISRATSYTHKEFKDLLNQRKPICSISYTQYIRAYQASEIINQVGKELSSVHEALPYPNQFVVNTVASIKREELLENIERMADRILIDRDLMKQLVDLHEIITDTIKKLKTSLDQVSMEGLPRADNGIGHSLGSLSSDKSLFIDKSVIRNEIAENFIVVGEPKNRCCYYEAVQTDADVEADLDYRPPERERDPVELVEVETPAVEAKTASTTISVEELSIKAENAAPTEKPAKTKKRREYWRKSKESKGKSTEQVAMTPVSTPIVIPPEEEPRQVNDGKECWRAPMNNDRCPDVVCGLKIDPQKMSVKELEMLVRKRASYTVGLRQYQLKCDEGIGEARAVLPTDFKFEDRPSDTMSTNLYNIDSRPAVIAESDTDDMLTEPAAPSPEPTPPQSPPRRSAPSTDTQCAAHCKRPGAPQCGEELDALRYMFHKIALDIDKLKDDLLIDLEDYEYTEPEYTGLADEDRITQETLYCLKELEKASNKLYQLNFMEVDAEIPEPFGCCFREFRHLHIKIFGIPVVVKIPDTLWDILLGRQSRPVSVDEPQVITPKRNSKSCECKPVTFGKLMKEKCAIAKMFKPKANEAGNKNKLVMMSVDPLYEEIFGLSPMNSYSHTAHQSAFQERDLDIFEVMDMQDSNTSLPYVVQRHSLPNVNVCQALPVTVPQLKQFLRSTTIEHPKPRIEKCLQNIGIDSLLKASFPAKCCKPAVFNGEDDDGQPFRASLNSLPLTTSDLQLITDIADEDDANEALCKYRPINYYFTATMKFKFECYTNFQENFASNYDYFVPPKTRVYQIFYFEIFKKDTSATHNSNTNTVNATASARPSDAHRRRISSTSTSSSHYHHLPHHHHHHHRRQHHLPNDSQYGRRNNEQDSSRQPSKSVIGEFFRRLIFNTEHSEEEIQAVDYQADSDFNVVPTPREAKKHQRSKSEERNERAKEKPVQQPIKKVKNQRLQVNSEDLDRHRQPAPTIAEVPEEYVEDIDGGFYKQHTNAISSSMKNYTVSRIATKTGTRTKLPSVKIKDSPRSSVKRSKKRTPANSTIRYETRNVKVGPNESHIPNRIHLRSVSMDDVTSDCSLSPQKFADTIDAAFELEQSFQQQAKSKCDSNSSVSIQLNHVLDRLKEKHIEKTKPSTEITSSKNLGTIYETDEKLPTKDSVDRHVPYRSVCELLRSPELSKSFEKFITSEQIVDSFAKSKIGPEQFWSMYFKARRESHQNASKGFSSTEDSEMRIDDLESNSPAHKGHKPPMRKLRSKIPKRIHVPYSDSSSDVSLTAFSFDPLARKKHAGPAHVKEMTSTSTQIALPISSAKLPETIRSRYSSMARMQQERNDAKQSKDQRNKTKIYFTEILDEAVKSHRKDAVSMQSLQVLASKNGPGYITVLHPVCGCPEVSIFIPCYCNDEGCQKHTPLTPKRIARLTAANDGRHIILPTTCRIPKILETGRKPSALEKRNRNDSHHSDSTA